MINLGGSASVATAELVIVVIKFVVLVGLAAGGLLAIDPGLLAPQRLSRAWLDPGQRGGHLLRV